MQIYLFQNGNQEGPFGLARIASRLVSGDLDSATPAWREGMDNWYPLHDPVWAEAGIVAPPPKAVTPVAETAPANESDSPAEESSGNVEKEADVRPFEESVSTDRELASEREEAQPEVSGSSFANYAEADFKPPSYDEMEGEMSQLRAKRETFPELIGRKVFESGIEDEEIEEAVAEVAKVKAQGNEKALGPVFAELGRAVMAAGITDPVLDELREEEQDISDRMLNLQMQLRRMGGGNRVKKPSVLRKWLVLLLAVGLLGAVIAALILFGNR